jgi:hypothetical protein
MYSGGSRQMWSASVLPGVRSRRHVVRGERARETSEVEVAQLDRHRAVGRAIGDENAAAAQEIEIVVDRPCRQLGGVDAETGLEVTPYGVRRVIAAHQVAVEEHVAPGFARGGDLPTGDRRRGGQDELDGVFHGLRGVVEEHIHRARADIDREDAIVGHASMLASSRNASARWPL